MPLLDLLIKTHDVLLIILPSFSRVETVALGIKSGHRFLATLLFGGA